VIGVDPTTGKETLISSNAMPVNASSQYFDYAQGITTDAAGDIFVTDPMAFGTGGGIIEVTRPPARKRSCPRTAWRSTRAASTSTRRARSPLCRRPPAGRRLV